MHRQLPSRAGLAVAIAALGLAPTAAQAADCLTPPEFTALATWALPSAIAGAEERCTPSLPADAFLRSGGKGLADRYAGGRAAAWPGAKAAITKISQHADANAHNIVEGLPDDTLQQVADTAITTGIADNLPLKRCGTVSRLVELLAPLPPENTAALIALAVGLGTATGHTRLGPILVCPA